MLSAKSYRHQETATSDPARHDWRALRAAAAVGVMYYAGAKVGLALTFAPLPISILWPPNALLFAALVLAPGRWWWLLIAGVFPAHLLAELQGGVPVAMVLGWFASNVSEAVIGAAIIRRLGDETPNLNSVRAVALLCVAAVLAPFASSFLDAAFVRLLAWGDTDYWTLWRVRLLSNTLSNLTFVPVVIAFAAALPAARHFTRPRVIEGMTLLAGLTAFTVIAFDIRLADSEAARSLLYLPVPFLVWAALRFGPPLTTASFTITALIVIWGASHGGGPFFPIDSPAEALQVQLFLLTLGVPLLLLAAMMEERRVAEQKLRASEELFSTAFRSGPDAIAISNRADGSVIEANDRWLALLQYRHSRGAPARIAPLATHLAPADSARLLAMTRDDAEVRDMEMPLRDCLGQMRTVLVSITPVQLQGDDCLISVVRDITEQRQAELEAREQRQQLTHLTRVASLTDFSSTLAHELNQPLTAILSNAQAALRFLARDPPNINEIRSILGEIADADKRAGLLIHHLRLLMKKGEEEFVRLDLNQMVKDVLDFVHGEFAMRSVDVTASFSPDLPQVSGDRVQLQQLVLNLISNACEAMQNQDRSSRLLSITTVQGADDSIQLVVSDTGPGIRDEKLDRVFEPFFTTKENGLGLGLPICRKIARAHGGTLSAENRGGGGATLRLVLPPADRSGTLR